jgi:hypothetical protein
VSDKHTAAAAAGKMLSKAKADLLSQTPLKGTSTSGSNKQPADLTEDEARAELFSSNRSGNSGGRKAKHQVTNSTNATNTAKVKATSDRGQLPSADAAHKQSGISSVAESTTASSTTGQSESSAAVPAVGGRRALLARPTHKDSNDGLGGSGATPSATAHAISSSDHDSSRKEAAGSSEQPTHSVPSASNRSWPDAGIEQEPGDVQLPSRQERSAAVLSRLPAAAVATSTSRQASLTSQAAVVSGARSKDSADDAALRQLAAENEKLRAQVVALRDQAAQVEDGWRQARLAAESAASDRDDYKAQVQELHDQLKEVNIMPS